MVTASRLRSAVTSCHTPHYIQRRTISSLYLLFIGPHIKEKERTKVLIAVLLNKKILKKLFQPPESLLCETFPTQSHFDINNIGTYLSRESTKKCMAAGHFPFFTFLWIRSDLKVNTSCPQFVAPDSGKWTATRKGKCIMWGHTVWA